MRIATLRHTEMARGLSALRVAVSSAVELALARRDLLGGSCE
jgi:hypothetical protein